MKKGNDSYDIVPKFFKVYFPGESGDDLELPIFINSYLPNCLPENVTVRSVHGKIWKMALRKCGGEKFVIVNGWKMISENEDLNGGVFLVFEFDGSRCFNYCIYESGTMCKRLRRSSVQSDEIKVEPDGEDETRATDDVLDLDDDEEDDADYNYQDDAAVEDDDEDYVDVSRVKDDDDVEAVDIAVVDDDEVETVDERQYLDDHENPSFTLTPNLKRKSQLRIPAQLIKDYDLHFPESITVIDPLVKKFGPLEMKMKIQKNGYVFVKGFGSVIRRNKVKTSDKMIFEIKKTGNNNLVHTIKIHIVSG